jgi:hypothetical protein
MGLIDDLRRVTLRITVVLDVSLLGLRAESRRS